MERETCTLLTFNLSQMIGLLCTEMVKNAVTHISGHPFMQPLILLVKNEQIAKHF